MVTRYGLDNPTDPSNKTQMWQLWDEFDLGGAEMVGWWHRSPLSHVTAHDSSSNCSEVYSTTYLHHGERALVALGSWQPANATQNCSLQLQWDRLGFHATTMQVPGIDGFQAPKQIAVGSSIQIPYQQGAIVVLTSTNACSTALASACSQPTTKGSKGVLQCDACVGRHQRELLSAGCTAAEVQSWCVSHDIKRTK